MTLENWMAALYGRQALAEQHARQDGMAQVVGFGAPALVWMRAAQDFVANRARVRRVKVRK